jgi:hypothetical protein
MSCPHFYPTESQGGGALFPLGDSWTGLCHADPANPAMPDRTQTCNFGYARGRCERFPDDGGPDAVRFTVSRADSQFVQIYFVQERDHHPFAHGPIELPLESSSVPAPTSLLARQAAAYVESYRRRRRD